MGIVCWALNKASRVWNKIYQREVKNVNNDQKYHQPLIPVSLLKEANNHEKVAVARNDDVFSG